MPDKSMWLVYVALAGLAWGTYVPFIFFGGNELGGTTPATASAPGSWRSSASAWPISSWPS